MKKSFMTLFPLSMIFILLAGCTAEKRVNKDDAPACNSEATIVLYKELSDEYNKKTTSMGRAIMQGRYEGLIGDKCQTFTKGIALKILEEKQTKSGFSSSLVESNGKTYWMYSKDLE